MNSCQRNQGKGRQKKKWVRVIKEDMRACGANTNMVINREG